MKQKVNAQTLIKNYGIILVLLLSFWAVKPLFINGFFPMHDDTQVARVFEMGKVLKMGIFPVRWIPDLGYGYGYPIFNFYAPMSYYVGGLFTLIGFDALVATKIMMIIGILLSGIFMYLLAREFWGDVGGIVSSLFYVYAPYHALDIYVRGDVAEFWAYAFIPLAFYGAYKIHKDYKHYKKWIVIGSLGFAGIILSHNLTALMITPFLFIFSLILIIFSKKETRLLNTLYLILYTFLGLALSAFYWVPALLEIKNTNVFAQIGGGADFRDHFVCLSQLWTSPWGFGGSTKGCVDGLSFMVGKLHIIGSVIALVLMFFPTRNKNYNSYKYYILLAFAGFVISVFFTVELSKSIWQAIPVMAFFQYPWRFLLLASFFSSLLWGFVVWFLQAFFSKGKYFNTVPYLSILCVIAILISFNSKFFQPQTIFQATSNDYTNEMALKWTTSKISDEYLPVNFKKPKLENQIAKTPAIPPQETTLEKVSNVVSLIGILGLIVGIILRWRN